MTDVYEFSEYERKNLIYNFATLTPEEVSEKKLNFEKMQAEKEAAKAAAEKAQADTESEKADNENSQEKPDTDKTE